MGRARTALTADQVEQALAYLQRALDRKADLFSTGIKETGRSLATLRKRKLALPWPDFVAEANAWLEQHLTPWAPQQLGETSVVVARNWHGPPCPLCTNGVAATSSVLRFPSYRCS